MLIPCNTYFTAAPRQRQTFNPDKVKITALESKLLGRHGSVSLCRDERENKMAATYNVLAFKR